MKPFDPQDPKYADLCIPAGPGRDKYLVQSNTYVPGTALPMTPEQALAREKEKADKVARAQRARQNGAKSKGPKTPDGKHQSSRSALKHGLTSKKHSVLDIEDSDEFLAHRQAAIDQFRPNSPFTLTLVEQLASINWRKERLTLIETAYFDSKINEQYGDITDTDPLTQAADGSDAIAALLRSWLQSSNNNSPIELLRRYLATLTHEFNTTLNNLLKLEKRDLQRRHDPSFDTTPYQEPQQPLYTKRTQNPPDPEPLNTTPRPQNREDHRP